MELLKLRRFFCGSVYKPLQGDSNPCGNDPRVLGHEKPIPEPLSSGSRQQFPIRIGDKIHRRNQMTV